MNSACEHKIVILYFISNTNFYKRKNKLYLLFFIISYISVTGIYLYSVFNFIVCAYIFTFDLYNCVCTS